MRPRQLAPYLTTESRRSRTGENGMTTQVDPGLQSVLDNINVIASSEGGSVEFVESRGGKLTVEYTPGVNEDCPECVPTHELIGMMLKSSVGILAPYISDVEVR